MTGLRDLLVAVRADQPETEVSVVAGAVVDREPITGWRLLEHLHEVSLCDTGQIAFATRTASLEVDSYLMDVAVRVATARGLHALFLVPPEGTVVSPMSQAVADRAGLCVVMLGSEVDLSSVLRATTRLLGSSLQAAMALARLASSEIDRLATAPAPEELAARVGGLFGRAIRVGQPTRGGVAVPVVVSDPDGPRFCADRAGDDDDDVLELVLWRAAAAVTAAAHRDERAQRLAMLSESDLVALLLGSVDPPPDLLRRARQMSIDTEGWHVVALIELDNLSELMPTGELGLYAELERLAALAVGTARQHGGTWHLTRTGTGLTLVHSAGLLRPHPAGARPVDTVGMVIKALVARWPSLVCYCGIGTPHEGPAGIRASTLEARSATGSARLRRRTGILVAYDSTSFRRALAEWHASSIARESAERILAPLTELKGGRGAPLVETLRSYLDNNGSLLRAAEELHLHRNAVAQRVKRALSLLDVDLEDPEQRLVLHLACRSVSLS